MSDGVWALYARRSVVREGDANVSIDSQRDVALRRVPEGATVEEFIDGGVGHHSGGGTAGRPEYRRMLEWLDTGKLAGIAAYDDTRLNRAADEQIRLFKACAARGVLLRTDDNTMTVAQMYNDGGGTKLTTLVKAGAAEYQLDMMRKKARDAASHTFASGGVWAKTPFGYRTVRNPETGKVERVDGVARKLRIEEAEAAVVRRVFDLLPSHPFSEIATLLNAEQATHGPTPKHQRNSDHHPNAWTSNTVKDVARRREFYAGRVTSKRGLLVNPGRHEAIISPEQYSDAVAGINARKRHTGAKPRYAKRTYILRGLVRCGVCGGRLRGDTRVSRGREWTYLMCPVSDGRLARVAEDGTLVSCDAKRLPTLPIERQVIDYLSTAALPPETIAEANAELRRRLAASKPGAADAERVRLVKRLKALTDLFGWDHISDADYRAQRAEVEAALAALPAEDQKLAEFERMADVVVSLPDTLAQASPEAMQALVATFVEAVYIEDRAVSEVVLVPAARALFASSAAVVAPPDGRRGVGVAAGDPLDWWATA